jgi:hypothetical protein
MNLITKNDYKLINLINKMDLLIIITVILYGYIAYMLYLYNTKLSTKEDILFNKHLLQEYNMNKLLTYAKILHQNNKNIMRLYDNQPANQVIIDIHKLNLTKDEINIVEGILLANGYTYYEI